MLSDLRDNHFVTGAKYFFRGLKLLLRPELRKFILIPLAVNCILFFTLTSLLLGYLANLNFDINFPEWLAWLKFAEKILKLIGWFVIAVVVIIGYGYSFNIITNIIAAPFYGVLAQKTEEMLTGEKLEDEPLYKMIPRTIFRELQKLLYFITRGIFVFLVMVLFGTVVILAPFAPAVGLVWSAWSMSIQYVDYPADNHQMDFESLRKILRAKKFSSLGFGATVMTCSMIPVVNIFAMPAAVTGGTLFWCRELKTLREMPTNAQV